MLGMHGLYEANMAMHDCDLMINIGARFDDRITGRIDAFSPKSTKAHIVGARPDEVITTGSLTGNIHLMLATFYQPRGTRRKIVALDTF